MPDWVATSVNKAIYDFLWNGKTELVKRSTCQLPFHHGGLAVINPKEKARALKLRWAPLIGDQSCLSVLLGFLRPLLGRPRSEPYGPELDLSQIKLVP